MRGGKNERRKEQEGREVGELGRGRRKGKKGGRGKEKKNNFSLIRFAMERKKRLDGNQEGISF